MDSERVRSGRGLVGWGDRFMAEPFENGSASDSTRKEPSMIPRRILDWLWPRVFNTRLYRFYQNHSKIHRTLWPDSCVKEARDWFSSNVSRATNILDLLHDQESKAVFKGILAFRQSGDFRLIPRVTRPQYFIPELRGRINPEKTVFIDCGAYNGDTALEYIKEYGDCARYVAFEPDRKNRKQLEQTLSHIKKSVIIDKGVYRQDTNLTFIETGETGSHLASDQDATKGGFHVTIPVAAIDNCPECHDATFIKMDIEGAEWDALHGAAKTIVRNKPILAICIYHSNEDMLRLIEYIHTLVPSYKLLVRHHVPYAFETVMYAIP